MRCQRVPFEWAVDCTIYKRRLEATLLCSSLGITPHSVAWSGDVHRYLHPMHKRSSSEHAGALAWRPEPHIFESGVGEQARSSGRGWLAASVVASYRGSKQIEHSQHNYRHLQSRSPGSMYPAAPTCMHESSPSPLRAWLGHASGQSQRLHGCRKTGAGRPERSRTEVRMLARRSLSAVAAHRCVP